MYLNHGTALSYEKYEAGRIPSSEFVRVKVWKRC